MCFVWFCRILVLLSFIAMIYTQVLKIDGLFSSFHIGIHSYKVLKNVRIVCYDNV